MAQKNVTISFLDSKLDSRGQDPVYNYHQVLPPLCTICIPSFSSLVLVSSSVDLVSISVTDQSLLAEVWSHSGSWECCTEESKVCTPICIGKILLWCVSLSTVSVSQHGCHPVLSICLFGPWAEASLFYIFFQLCHHLWS